MGLILTVILAIILNISGAVVCKFISISLTSYFWVIGLGGLLASVYLGRVYFWIWVGRQYQISYIYPLLSVSYVISFFLGIIVFDEPFLFNRLLGALVIMTGVVFSALSTNRREEPKV